MAIVMALVQRSLLAPTAPTFACLCSGRAGTKDTSASVVQLRDSTPVEHASVRGCLRATHDDVTIPDLTWWISHDGFLTRAEASHMGVEMCKVPPGYRPIQHNQRAQGDFRRADPESHHFPRGGCGRRDPVHACHGARAIARGETTG